jgi:hypothetical protein
MSFVVSFLAAVAVLAGAWSGGTDRLVAVGLVALLVGRYAVRRHLGWGDRGRPAGQRPAADPGPPAPPPGRAS